jgi:hypothetical protein
LDAIACGGVDAGNIKLSGGILKNFRGDDIGKMAYPFLRTGGGAEAEIQRVVGDEDLGAGEEAGIAEEVEAALVFEDKGGLVEDGASVGTRGGIILNQ